MNIGSYRADGIADTQAKQGSMAKRMFERFALGVLQFYFRHSPPLGKDQIWKSVVRPYFGWRKLRIRSRVASGMKMNLVLPDVIQTFLCFFGVWEPLITRYVTSTLKEGDIAVDVGANIGYYTLLFSKAVGRSGHVYAVEASPTIFGMLEANIRLNELQNVTAINAAVSDHACRVPIYLDKNGNLGGSTTVADVAASKGDEVEAIVEGDTLPNLISPDVLCRARLIKIDVEGAELPVLQGLASLLPRLALNAELIMEINASALAQRGSKPDELLDLFRAAGFSPFFLDNQYTPAFYINPPKTEPRPVLNFSYEHADIIFRRVPE
jgi:FkbM family methyltransferase